LSRPSASVFLSSGLIEITPEAVDRLPETAAWFRLRSPGQKVVYVGHAGAGKLAEAVRGFLMAQPVAGVETVEYEPASDQEAARVAAEADVEALRPLYNTGFERYRTTETILPTKGPGTRRAMHNP